MVARVAIPEYVRVLEPDPASQTTRCGCPGGRITMDSKTSNALRWSGLATALGLAATLLTTSGDPAHAQSSASGSENGLVGTWTVHVTLRDCTTHAALSTFPSLVTFHRGGTLTDAPGGTAYAVGQRSPGQGTWTHAGGHTYEQRIIALILFGTPPNLPGTPGFNPNLPVSPGFFAGWSTVTHTIEQTDDDHLESSGTNAFYKSDGTLYRTGCSTATGERFN
jgi:hypothetical protein